MRKLYEEILKRTFRKRIMRKRAELKVTQFKMAELLEMSLRSYSDIENGINCCGALTLVIYLIYYCEDVPGFLDGLKAEFEDANDVA